MQIINENKRTALRKWRFDKPNELLIFTIIFLNHRRKRFEGKSAIIAIFDGVAEHKRSSVIIISPSNRDSNPNYLCLRRALFQVNKVNPELLRRNR